MLILLATAALNVAIQAGWLSHLLDDLPHVAFAPAITTVTQVIRSAASAAFDSTVPPSPPPPPKQSTSDNGPSDPITCVYSHSLAFAIEENPRGHSYCPSDQGQLEETVVSEQLFSLPQLKELIRNEISDQLYDRGRLGEFIGSLISDELRDRSQLETLIKSLISDQLPSHEKLMRDFALAADGARIVCSLTSGCFGSPIFNVKNSPYLALTEDTRVGNCWSSPSSHFQLGILLPASIVRHSFPSIIFLVTLLPISVKPREIWCSGE